MQLIPVNRNNPPVDEQMVIAAPPEIIKVLESSCYDCHSNRTNWPFYSYVAPVSWLIAQDVKEGRGKLNFSEWSKSSVQKRERLKEEIIEEIENKDMPLPIYLILHPRAELSDQQKQMLEYWTGAGAPDSSAVE